MRLAVIAAVPSLLSPAAAYKAAVLLVLLLTQGVAVMSSVAGSFECFQSEMHDLLKAFPTATAVDIADPHVAAWAPQSVALVAYELASAQQLLSRKVPVKLFLQLRGGTPVEDYKVLRAAHNGVGNSCIITLGVGLLPLFAGSIELLRFQLLHELGHQEHEHHRIPFTPILEQQADLFAAQAHTVSPASAQASLAQQAVAAALLSFVRQKAGAVSLERALDLVISAVRAVAQGDALCGVFGASPSYRFLHEVIYAMVGQLPSPLAQDQATAVRVMTSFLENACKQPEKFFPGWSRQDVEKFFQEDTRPDAYPSLALRARVISEKRLFAS